MGKEVLAIPEERLAEVVAVLRAGLRVVEVSDDTRRGLTTWCDDIDAYLTALLERSE